MVRIKRKLGEKKKRRKNEKVDSIEVDAFQADVEGKFFCYIFDGFGVSECCAYFLWFLCKA